MSLHASFAISGKESPYFLQLNGSFISPGDAFRSGDTVFLHAIGSSSALAEITIGAAETNPHGALDFIICAYTPPSTTIITIENTQTERLPFPWSVHACVYERSF